MRANLYRAYSLNLKDFNFFDSIVYMQMNQIDNILSTYFYDRTLPPFLVTLRRLDSSTQVYADIPFGDSTSQYI